MLRPRRTAALALAAATLLAACGGPGGGSAEPPAPVTSAPASPVTSAAEAPTTSTPTEEAVGQRLGRTPRGKDLAQALRRSAEAEARAEARDEAADDNPLAGRPWGVYTGPREPSYQAYAGASGSTRAALAKIALAPKAVWFGAWIPDSQIATKVREYIANAQAGDPTALVQMTVFRMVPWEQDTCRRLPSAAEQASYRRWIDGFASAVGDTPTAIVLQPDGPFALCAPGGPGVPALLIRYAATTLSALPNTSVYIEVGAADWPAAGQGGVDRVLDFLLLEGIEAARGIALNGTHYSATELEIARGAEIVRALAARGIEDKHVVINTSGNGNPFPYGTYTGANADNANVCRSATDPATCVTLGIPPTADVADPRWGLPDDSAALAREYVDGYLWFGRPWLYLQNYPFQLSRALQLVASTPY